MIIAFDLDDTLYEEITFVKSGLNSVSNYLFKKFSIPIEESTNFLHHELVNGREQILDKLLRKFKLYSKHEVRKCLSIYRNHYPDIQLIPQANLILERFKDVSLYVVTDGNKIVQKNKIYALGLPKKIKSYILTSNYGLKNAKPSPHCFMHICKKENVRPSEFIYIGDNPNKDFVGIKPLGFKTIRILSGRYKNIKKNEKYEADLTLNSLAEVTNELVENYLNNFKN